MIGKIYKVTNLINNKIYIGQTTKSIEERFKQHISKAYQGKENNHFYSAIRKYGKENFTIELLEDNVPIESIINKEEEYIIKFDSVNNGYNMKYKTEDPRYKTLVFESKEYLEDLYINQKLSTIQIAKMFGVVNTTVGNRLKALGIPTRKCGQGNRKIKSYPSKEEFYELFIVQNKTAKQIADMFGIAKHQVQNLRVTYNIYKYHINKI